MEPIFRGAPSREISSRSAAFARLSPGPSSALCRRDRRHGPFLTHWSSPSLVFTNITGRPVNNIQFTDPIPEGMHYLQGTASAGWHQGLTGAVQGGLAGCCGRAGATGYTCTMGTRVLREARVLRVVHVSYGLEVRYWIRVTNWTLPVLSGPT